MTAKVVHVPEAGHVCMAPPVDAQGRVAVDFYRWHRPGTVMQCECGRTFVAYVIGRGQSGVGWRPERRRERRRREQSR